MADPLLNTLCAICHTNPPKYTCPACHAATCSLPCTQRHKAWADCTGRRDPTVYLPLQQLQTPAGVDHDFNFLSSIERARERAQRELVEDRGIFTDKSLERDLDQEDKWRREWFGDELAPVSKRGERQGGLPGRRTESDDEKADEREGARGKGKNMSSLQRLMRERLEVCNVEVIHVPVGMSRQRENTTAWNRRTHSINWCVEWVFYDQAPTAPTAPPSTTGGEQIHQPPSQPLRLRGTALEAMPLYRAFGTALARHRYLATKAANPESEEYDSDDPATLPQRKKRIALIRELKSTSRTTTAQHFPTATYCLSPPYPAQNPHTTAWGFDRSATTTSWDADAATARFKTEGWRFYLQRHVTPGTPGASAKELIPIDGLGEGIGRAVSGRRVMEFPTVFVLPPRERGADKRQEWLPEGWTRGLADRREVRKTLTKGRKRKATQQEEGARNGAKARRGRGGAAGGGRGRGRGRGERFDIPRRGKDEELEEGEIGSGDDGARPPHSSRRGRRQAAAVDAHTHTMAGEGDTSRTHVDDEQGPRMMAMDLDHAPPASSSAAPPLRADTSLPPKPPKPSLALVDYGSSEDNDEEDGEAESGSDDDDDQEEVDMALLKPEDPELVASAIQEIVGLFTT